MTAFPRAGVLECFLMYITQRNRSFLCWISLDPLNFVFVRQQTGLLHAERRARVLSAGGYRSRLCQCRRSSVLPLEHDGSGLRTFNRHKGR